MSRQAVQDDDLHFGSLPDDPTGVSDCSGCKGHGVVGGTTCPSCVARQGLRNAWWESSGGRPGWMPSCAAA